jgi:hypothetical protein
MLNWTLIRSESIALINPEDSHKDFKMYLMSKNIVHKKLHFYLIWIAQLTDILPIPSPFITTIDLQISFFSGVGLSKSYF